MFIYDIVSWIEIYYNKFGCLYQILFVEEEPFLSYSFLPEEHLVVTNNETGTIGTGDFIIDETSNITQVGIHYVENEYHGNLPPNPYPWLIYIGPIALIAIVAIIWWYRRPVKSAL